MGFAQLKSFHQGRPEHPVLRAGQPCLGSKRSLPHSLIVPAKAFLGENKKTRRRWFTQENDDTMEQEKLKCCCCCCCCCYKTLMRSFDQKHPYHIHANIYLSTTVPRLIFVHCNNSYETRAVDSLVQCGDGEIVDRSFSVRKLH